MARRRLTLPVLVLALAAGCGGEKTLSAQAYRSQADTVCAEANRGLSALGRPSTVGELGAFFERGLSLSQRLSGRYRALKPPKELKGTHRAVVDLQAKQLAEIRRTADELKAAKGEAAATAVLQRSEPQLTARANQLKQRYGSLGLRECGKQ